MKLASFMTLALLGLTAYTPRTQSMDQSQLTDFASRYAAAWSSQNPQGLVSFYAKNASITMNAGTPAVGGAAIAAKAGEFMTAFPNMIVMMDSVSLNGSHATFHVDRKKYGPWRLGQARSN